MKTAYTTGREVTCHPRGCSGDLKSEHCLHGVHGPLCASAGAPAEQGSFPDSRLSAHKYKENTTSEMHKASKHTSTLNHALSLRIPTLATYSPRELSTCV